MRNPEYILAVGFSHDLGENYIIFGSHIGEGDNTRDTRGCTAGRREKRKGE